MAHCVASDLFSRKDSQQKSRRYATLIVSTFLEAAFFVITSAAFILANSHVPSL